MYAIRSYYENDLGQADVAEMPGFGGQGQGFALRVILGHQGLVVFVGQTQISDHLGQPFPYRKFFHQLTQRDLLYNFV